ncbi:uncharacterized protein LOC142606247 [Castanea sativa]|uniref:uncharacterized protein LOC142606247 n=1 Tax=Castanea sativa TaxID=21020 RepID=UPI003F64EFC2
MGAVSSTLHLKVKYPTQERVGELQLKGLTVGQQVGMLGELTKELEKVVIGLDQKHYFQVGSQLPPLKKEELVKFLEADIDVFAWSTYDVPRIDPGFICHQLNVNPKEKTAFRAPNGNYHYRVMPFGLKNKGFTYQNMVTRMFESQFGRNMELLLQALLRKSDYTGRIAKWGTVLGAYDVKYIPRTAIKWQILADFMAEFTEGTIEKEERALEAMATLAVIVPPWKIYIDEASNRKGVRVGIVLITSEKMIMERSLRLGFLATNNEAEYEALLVGVAMVRQLFKDVVELYSDSRLVVGQVNGEFEARDEMMQGYLAKVQHAWAQFKGFVLKQIPRGQNSHVVSLAMLATSLGSSLPRVVAVEDMDSSNLMSGLLPEDKGEAKKVCRSAPRYWLSEEQKLYRNSHSGPYLLCVHPEAVEPLLEELHEGICGSHTGGGSLVHRALTQGYWWPGIPKTSQDYVKKYEQCQREQLFTPRHLDVAEERREVVTVKMTYYRQKHKQGYDKGVKSRPLAAGDLVLRKVVETAKNLAWVGKGHIGSLPLLALGLIT